VRELKGFQKALLRKGETQTVSFQLTAEDLEFWTINRRMEADSGEFNLWVGGLHDRFKMVDQPLHEASLLY
jgi:beta-glucosidase